MKKQTKITWSIVLSLLVVGIFTSICVCTYTYDWNLSAFWWSWFVIVWLVDIVVGIYIFYKKNRTDEIKTFWLLTMVVLPMVGAIIAFFFNYKSQSEYGKPNNDHSKLQSALFKAKKSIKIYSNSLFVSDDTFNALNFATWKNVNVQLIISIQNKKWKQEFLIYKLRKMLEPKINLHLTNKTIEGSFIIIDDELVIVSPKNFNFTNIYSNKIISETNEITEFERTWKNDLERTSSISLETVKIHLFKKIKVKVINIFSPFF